MQYARTIKKSTYEANRILRIGRKAMRMITEMVIKIHLDRQILSLYILL